MPCDIFLRYPHGPNVLGQLSTQIHLLEASNELLFLQLACPLDILVAQRDIDVLYILVHRVIKFISC